MKKNILVFPCGSEIGLDIHSSVRYSTHFNLIGASSVDDHGKFVYENYIGEIPFISSENFIDSIKSIVEDYAIDAIYPTMDSVITVLKGKEEYLNCKVISSPFETANICLSKSKTYTLLRDIIRVPIVYNSSLDKLSFPVIAKPDIGYGARGVKMINNRDELFTTIEKNKEIIICEYLPGEEYTVDCFTDFKGNLLYSNARKRNRVKGGISVNSSFEKNQSKFIELAQIINNNLNFNGAWFFQLKRDSKGELCLLEIAARLGGSSLLSRAIGVNLALLSLFNAFEKKVNVTPNNYYIELDRALDCKYKTNLFFEKIYVDFDDCLVLNNSSLNLDLVKFLFKCRNENKKIILLTKHIGNLEFELKKYAISEIFHEIIQIRQECEKVDYISGNAIFIDDSNKERCKVKEKLEIPVFAPDMIDVLVS